jgi:hypothetical protein
MVITGLQLGRLLRILAELAKNYQQKLYSLELVIDLLMLGFILFYSIDRSAIA